MRPQQNPSTPSNKRINQVTEFVSTLKYVLIKISVLNLEYLSLGTGGVAVIEDRDKERVCVCVTLFVWEWSGGKERHYMEDGFKDLELVWEQAETAVCENDECEILGCSQGLSLKSLGEGSVVGEAGRRGGGGGLCPAVAECMRVGVCACMGLGGGVYSVSLLVSLTDCPFRQHIARPSSLLP